mgnify:FL=1
MGLKDNKLYFYLPILSILLTNFLFSIHVLLIEDILGFEYFFEVNLLLTVLLIIILSALAILSLHYAKTNHTISSTQKNYSLSIIVPVYNEENLITKTLKSIAHQKIPGSTFEIIVVNDSSDDQSLNLIQKFIQSTKVNVSLINSIKNEGKKTALIKGFNASKGEIIITVDSDTILESHAISKLCKQFDEGTSAVCGYS